MLHTSPGCLGIKAALSRQRCHFKLTVQRAAVSNFHSCVQGTGAFRSLASNLTFIRQHPQIRSVHAVEKQHSCCNAQHTGLDAAVAQHASMMAAHGQAQVRHGLLLQPEPLHGGAQSAGRRRL